MLLNLRRICTLSLHRGHADRPLTYSPCTALHPRGTFAVAAGMSDKFKRRRVDSPSSPIYSVVEASETLLQHAAGTTFKIPGVIVRDHFFKVPLDHSGELEGHTIDIFVRELVAPANDKRPNQPYLLFLQGGPGFESPRPTEANGWIKSALNSFRVILMDQRGTGRSSQITTKSLSKLEDPQDQAEYLSYFRADSIVRDAELVRTSLVPKSNHDGRWSILGQSFGGFCCLTYLSIAPQGLIEVMMTGGIPPGISAACSADSVYTATLRRVLTQNQRYYQRFPGDEAAVQKIVNYLASQPEGGVRLPSGTLLTPRAFQSLGLSGLGSGGGFERLHYLIETFWDDDEEVNPSFIKQFESWMPWDVNPLYALLHEAIYCQGMASKWSAQRIITETYAQEFDAVAAANAGKRVNFTGECVFPWVFEDFAALRPFKAAADLLAKKADWPALYDAEQLAANKVPVVAATYLEDMYVDYDLAQETAGGVAGLRQWVTSEYKHSGIRDDGARIFDRLLAMARDVLLVE